jgi:hypothetical protein
VNRGATLAKHSLKCARRVHPSLSSRIWCRPLGQSRSSPPGLSPFDGLSRPAARISLNSKGTGKYERACRNLTRVRCIVVCAVASVGGGRF